VSVSRGAYLAVGISLFVFFVVMLFSRDFRLPAAGILILLLVAGSLSGMRSWQAKKRFAGLEGDNIRLKYWHPAVELSKQNPWFGIGPEHYDWRFQPWRYWQTQGRPYFVHNDYLQTVTEYGTVGAGIVALGLIFFGWGVFKTWKYVRRTNEIATKPSNRSAVVFGCSVGLLAILVHSAVDFNMHIPANALIAVTLLAIVTSHLRFATERYWFNPGVFGRLLGTALVAGTMGYLGWQLSHLGPESYLLRKFHSKPATFENGMATLKKAYAAEPRDGDVAYEIGERLRVKAFEADDGWEQLTHEAITWLERGIQLNHWNAFAYVSLGQCYDWLNQPQKAADYFEKALSLDPKQHYVLSMYGWHLFQVGELERAYKYFKESYIYYRNDNPVAEEYMKIIETRLAEQGKKL
jgi:tetratricopeptide (TPR) repeat protein